MVWTILVYIAWQQEHVYGWCIFTWKYFAVIYAVRAFCRYLVCVICELVDEVSSVNSDLNTHHWTDIKLPRNISWCWLISNYWHILMSCSDVGTRAVVLNRWNNSLVNRAGCLTLIIKCKTSNEWFKTTISISIRCTLYMFPISYLVLYHSGVSHINRN